MAFDRKEYKKAWSRKRHLHNRELIRRWKMTKGCAECGYKKHYSALQLDHIDPSTKCKTRKGSQALNYKWNNARIKKELSGCQVLCANCHAERTHREKHYLLSSRCNGDGLHQ